MVRRLVRGLENSCWLWCWVVMGIGLLGVEAQAAKEYKRELVVAADGSGDYTSLR